MVQKRFVTPSDVTVEGAVPVDPFTGQITVPPYFGLAVAAGLCPSWTVGRVLGMNPDVDTGTTPESVWSGGGRYPWIPTARALQIRSTSAADTAAGTGAASVAFTLLDSGRLPLVTPNVTLNGLTAVPISGLPFRINSASLASMGSARAVDDVSSNAGDLIIEDVAAPNTVRAIIPAGAGRLKQAAFTVPMGFTLMINSVLLDVKSPSGSVGQYFRLATWFKMPSGVVIQPIEFGNTSSGPYLHESDPPITALQGWDVDLLVTNTSDNNEVVTAAFNGFIRQNVYP